MTRLIAVVLALVVSACVNDTNIGDVDGGATGGSVGGSATGGGVGGGATGGGVGGATGGGFVGFSDAGLVARIPDLPMNKCAWEMPAAPCPGDAGPCLMLHRQGQPPQMLYANPRLVRLPGHPIRASKWFGVLAMLSSENLIGGDYFNTDGGQPAAFIGVPLDGGAPVVIDGSDAGEALRIFGIAEADSYGLWYQAERSRLNQGAQLSLNVAAQGSVGNVAAANVEASASPLADGSDYYAINSQTPSLWSYYPAGGGSLITGVVTDFAINGDTIVVLRCTGVGCALVRYSKLTPSVGVVLASELPLNGVGTITSPSGRQVVIAGQFVYAIGNRHLVRVPLAGGAVQVVYRGDDFPQYGGTLAVHSLRVRDGKLLFGSVCYFDADAPGYATIELDPNTNTARWLNLDTSFPYATTALDPGSSIASGPSRYVVTPAGIVEFVP